MTPKEINTLLLELSTTIKHYEQGSYICTQNQDFNKIGIVLKGKVMCSRTCLCHNATFSHILKMYETFGEDLVCAGHDSLPYDVIALENTTLLFIEVKDLLLLGHPYSPYINKFLINLLSLIANRHLISTEQIEYTRIPSLKRRVAAFLLNQYEQTGQLLFTTSLSRCEMASYLSVTRPALSKVLSELKKEEIIDYYKDSFKIQNLDKLMQL